MTRVLVIALILATAGGLRASSAAAATGDQPSRAAMLALQWTNRLVDQAEGAIVLGGIMLERNRYAVSGGMLGCTAGAVTGIGSVLALGAATGGAALAGTSEAAVLGCAFGAAAGAALGVPLDHRIDR